MSNANDLNNTRKYIRLFQMQLHGVLLDMAQPADNLSSKFSDSLMKLNRIQNHLMSDDDLNVSLLKEQVKGVINEMFDCISCMQFVDAKRQRLEHVADGLSYLIEENPINLSMKYNWDDINSMIIDMYKMDKEREIYENFLNENSTNNDMDDKFKSGTS